MKSSLGRNGVRPSLLNVEAGDDEEDAPGITDDETDDEVVDDYAKRDGEDAESDSAGGEAEVSMGICMPCKPDAETVEDHNRTHFPWRNWCEVCVKAAGRVLGHKSLEGKERRLTEYHFDFCFLGDELG